jgi:hypothetical protein
LAEEILLATKQFGIPESSGILHRPYSMSLLSEVPFKQSTVMREESAVLKTRHRLMMLRYESGIG